MVRATAIAPKPIASSQAVDVRGSETPPELTLKEANGSAGPTISVRQFPR